MKLNNLFNGIPVGQELLGSQPVRKNGWGAAVGAGLTAIGSLVGASQVNQANANLNQTNRKWQSRENEKQRVWSKQMWDAENAYNTPEMQKQRLIQGGFNPWLASDNAGMSSMAGSPTAPGMQGAPNTTPMKDVFGGAISSGVNTYLQGSAIESNIAQNSANTDKLRADSNLTNAKAQEQFIENYKNLYDVDKSAAYEYGAQNINGFTNQGSYFHLRQETDIIAKELNNARNSLELALRDKYGDKESWTKISEMEAIITKNFGELGLMNSQAELNRENINLMMKQAYELGAKAASEFAQARLLTSDAKINEALLPFIKKTADLDYNSKLIDYNEKYSWYDSRTGVRDYMHSDEGKKRSTWAYKQSPEGNYVNAFLKGFTESTNTSFNFGGNYNYSRSYGQHNVQGRYSSNSNNVNWNTSRKANNMTPHNPLW